MIRNRRMTRGELDVALDWAAEEGWNPGLDDADAFWAADPEGFFVADEDGVPVAAISVVRHGPDFAFLGLYLCRPSHRGRGIGLALWRHALAHAGDRTVGLDGVEAQQANYEASGFRRAGETVRHAGRLDAPPPDGLRAARPEDVPALIALEAAASGCAKPAYMAAWFGGSATRRTLVLERDGRAVGAATARRCRAGAKVGPLLAPDASSAMALLAVAAGLWGTEIMIDVPDRAAGFGRRLAGAGLRPVFRTARMYSGPPPSPLEGDVLPYGVTSLELG